MNIIKTTDQKAIIQAYDKGLSMRMIANIIGCSKVTVRRYLKLNGKETRSIKEAMVGYHVLRKTKYNGNESSAMMKARLLMITPMVHCECCGFTSSALKWM